MLKFRLLLWMVVLLMVFAACTQAESIEEPAVVEATPPTATAVPIEPIAEPTATAQPTVVEIESDPLEDFVSELQTAVINQDYVAMQALMSDPIAVAGWRSEGRMIEPAQAVLEYQNSVLPTPLTVQFTGLTEDELTNLLGQTPASMFGPASSVAAVLHSTGWGVESNHEAILFVTEEDGRYAWSAFLFTFGSFDESNSSGLMPFVETDVNLVQAQQDVVMYSRPGESYDEIGGIFDGQSALVTGQSEDGNWWRVICPDDTIGDCWVTADPAFTLPTGSGTNESDPTSVITAEPIFTGGDLQFVGWSPNGRYLAYYEYTEEQVAESPVEGLRGTYPGTFVFYDVQTGEKCTDYPFSGFFNYEGGGSGSQWRWLPNGQLLLSLPDGQLLQNDAPCEPGENLVALFPTLPSSIGSLSPNDQWLTLVSGGQYWLYDWMAQNAHPIAEVQPDSFNNLVWSPDSRHISITLAGNYTGDRSPIGGTRVIEVATGEVAAQHDWEPANALDGTFGGPVWINNDEFVVTLSLDQGPFLMDIDGEVQPLLPLLFDETFDPENYWPPLDVYADVASGRYAILRSNEGREDAAKLYISTPDGDSVEILDNPAFVYHIFPGGMVGYEGVNGRYFSRPVFETNAPFAELPAGTNPWMPGETNLHVAANGGTVTIFDRAQDEFIARLQLEGYETGYTLNPLPSPNEQWLAIFVNESRYSLGKALFVLPIPTN